MGFGLDMKSLFIDFLKSEDGATAIEYGIIAALIAIALIGGIRALGKGTERAFWCAKITMQGRNVDDGAGPCAAFESGGG